jgi:CRP/FNR family transcriptional regulator
MLELKFASPHLSLVAETTCGLSEFCCLGGPVSAQQETRSVVACNKKQVKLRRALYNLGDPLPFVFHIVSGSFKTSAVTAAGQEQVLGFHLRGELLGLDAIGRSFAPSNAIAMEDSQVCVISYDMLEQRCEENRALQVQFTTAMANEISTKQSMMLLLGQMSAEERVAYFLLDLGKRFSSLGYSASDMNLRMTREEMGSYLGMKLETVSRVLSALNKQKLVNVDNKHIEILDAPGLMHRLAGLSGSANRSSELRQIRRRPSAPVADTVANSG